MTDNHRSVVRAILINELSDRPCFGWADEESLQHALDALGYEISYVPSKTKTGKSQLWWRVVDVVEWQLVNDHQIAIFIKQIAKRFACIPANPEIDIAPLRYSMTSMRQYLLAIADRKPVA